MKTPTSLKQFEHKQNQYEYIVVGASAAGVTLATRLSEDPTVSVLLLDVASEGRSGNEPMIAMRGMVEDYDNWANLGCNGWSGREVLSSFIRLEDDRNFGDKPYHGEGGPFPITRTPVTEWNNVDRALYTAAHDLGYGWSIDSNAPGSTGISPVAYLHDNDTSFSSRDPFLRFAQSRANLQVIGDTFVDRIVFQGHRAIGVRACTSRQWRELYAEEVLLCTGAIHSPAILMRSGIGAATDLEQLDIHPLVDVPGVGQNLCDHPTLPMRIRLRQEIEESSGNRQFANCCVRYGSGVSGAGINDMLMIAKCMSGLTEDLTPPLFLA